MDIIYHFLDYFSFLLLASWLLTFAVSTTSSSHSFGFWNRYPFSSPVRFQLLNLAVFFFADFYRFAGIQPPLTNVCLCFCQKVPRFSLAIMQWIEVSRPGAVGEYEYRLLKSNLWYGWAIASLRREMQMNTRSINPTSLSIVWPQAPCDWPKLITDKFKRPGTGLNLMEIYWSLPTSLTLSELDNQLFSRDFRSSFDSLSEVKNRSWNPTFVSCFLNLDNVQRMSNLCDLFELYCEILTKLFFA